MKIFPGLLLLILFCSAYLNFYGQSTGDTLVLGNQVWNDFDGDGKRDTNEPGIGGVTVSLYTDNNANNFPDGHLVIATTITNTAGLYSFTHLKPGRYIASIPILPGYQQSPNTSTQSTSPNPNNNVDNDNNIIRRLGANAPGGILFTNAITLSRNGEPTTDGDGPNGNLTFDLAECGNAFIGDFVWNDINKNGIQEPNEAGINGVKVTITFQDGTTATTTTNTYNAPNNPNAPNYDGYYNFQNLGPGTYKITFTTPSGYVPSPANQGGNDDKDSDPVNGSVSVTLVANQSNFTIDAGFYKFEAGNLTLGNQVWNDFDGDGKRDPNEPGIAGATVSLYTDNDSNNRPDGAAVRTTMSDSMGRYLFTGLPASRYIASMPILLGYQKSPNTSTQATSPFPDNNVDNDNNLDSLVGPNGPGGIIYTRNAITLSEGDEPTTDGDGANGNLTLDLAECGNAFIGDFVWDDINKNGIQEPNERGINGVKVTITFQDGTTATTTTNTYNAPNNPNTPNYDGYYNFQNLGPGIYKITFTTPSGYVRSPANQGGNDAKDSDPVNGSASVTITANQSNFTIDAGFYKKFGTGNLTLGNQVWNDFDGDGKRDPNEPGIAGATVSLYTDNDSNNRPDGAAVRTTMSDSLGRYLFTGLPAGRYIASMPILLGYQKSPNTSTQATSPFPDNNVDNDNNLDSLVGPNGPGGIIYTRNAITLSEGYEPTTDGDGANGNLTLDLAECGNAFIGDFVWNDINKNGIQEPNERGINGVKVTITFQDGTTATTTTNTYNAPNNPNAPNYDGYYNFQNLGPGTYKITFTTPSGYVRSPANQGGNDAKDSDPVDGSVSVTLVANQSNFTIDAGFYKKFGTGNLTLGNLVWNDFDGDGKRDPNEPGIRGATVSLYTDNDSNNRPDGAAVRTTMSDSLGRYLFTGLPAGRYIASMPILLGYQKSPNTSTQATSPFPDNNVDNDNNLDSLVGPNGPGGIIYTRNAITLSEGDEPATDEDGPNGNLTLDLAECGNSAIGDFVWNDTNANGMQDPGEHGINGVKVTITFEDGTQASTFSSTYNSPNNANAPEYDGYYNFINLGGGTYKITFTRPSGMFPSPALEGSNRAKDSNPADSVATVTIAPNQSDFTIDAGFTSTPPVPKLALGNLVFCDENGNGVKDSTELGIGGLWVNLYRDSDSNGFPDGAAIATVTTASDGTYLFAGLAPGNYMVGVKLVSPYINSFTGSFNPNNDVDNDNNGINLFNGEVWSTFITLTPGTEPINDGSDNNSNLTLDVGLKGCTNQPASPAPPITATNSVEDDRNKINSASIAVYPNPSVNYFVLTVKSVKEGQAHIRVIDQTGRTVMVQKTNVKAGTTPITFDKISALHSGLYTVQAFLNGQTFNQKLVIAK